jgi:hypothetical protein
MKAGATAFALVFVAGFVLGTIRVLVVVPRTGETTAVLLELPVMLAISWFATGWTIRRFDLHAADSRAIMGATAFSLLMLAEAALAVAVFGTSLGEWARGQTHPPGSYGLVGQIAFGLMPMLYPASRRGR